MNNAHLRFGWLRYVKSTEKSATSIKLRLDRFIGELLPDPPRQAKAHLISVIGGDTQIAAVSAAISLGDRFLVEGPDLAPTRVCLEPNAQCFKGSIPLAGSEEFAARSTAGTIENTPGGLEQKFPMGFDRRSLRHSWNAGLGGMVHE